MRRGRTAAFGYPVLPAIYIAMAAWICVVLLRYKPQYTWPGLILVLLGVPVYLVWKRLGTAASGETRVTADKLTSNDRRQRTHGESIVAEIAGYDPGRGG